MATGMVTFNNDQEAGTYDARFDGGTKMQYARKYQVEIVIAGAATAGVPIAATLNLGVGVPGDLLESGDDFTFSLKDTERNIFRIPLGGSAAVD